MRKFETDNAPITQGGKHTHQEPRQKKSHWGKWIATTLQDVNRNDESETTMRRYTLKEDTIYKTYDNEHLTTAQCHIIKYRSKLHSLFITF